MQDAHSLESLPTFLVMKIQKMNHHSNHVTLSPKENQSLREVAALYEKEFTRQLLKAMRQTVPEGALIPKNQAEKIFEEELYNQYGDLLAEKGDGSLREMIYQNLVERYQMMKNHK